MVRDDEGRGREGEGNESGEKGKGTSMESVS